MESNPSTDDESETPKEVENPTLSESMNQPPSKKAKVEVDPIYIAVIYIRWLTYINPSSLFFMCPYVGQAVRDAESAEWLANQRWNEENSLATREDKDMGLTHCLNEYGPDKFRNEVVEWRKGPRSEVQAWADEREKALIAEYGGPFRNPEKWCEQTLNLTHGGKNDSKFASMDAFRTVKWMKFKIEMQTYVDLNESALVPKIYVNPVSGYKLGDSLCHVRNGILWKGHPDWANRIEWLEALPKWAWNQKKTTEWRSVVGANSVARWANKTKDQREDWISNLSDAQNRPERLKKGREDGKAQYAREKAEGKKTVTQHGADWWTRATEEQLQARMQKILATGAAKRIKRLAGLSSLEREKKDKEAEHNKRSAATRKSKALAMMQLAEYDGKTVSWCESNMAKATKNGDVVFSKDSNGAWHAAMKSSGDAGSSAEHAE